MTIQAPAIAMMIRAQTMTIWAPAMFWFGVLFFIYFGIDIFDLVFGFI